MGITKLEKDIKKIDKSLDLSIGWLEESGIQKTKQSKLSGSVNAWYDPNSKKIFFRLLRNKWLFYDHDGFSL